MPRANEPKQEFLDALWKSAGLITIACEQSGFSYKDYKRELSNDPDFKIQVQYMKEKVKDIAEAELFKMIERGYDKAIFFYLKHNAKDRGYGETLDVIHSVEQPLLRPLDDSDDYNIKALLPNNKKNNKEDDSNDFD